MEKTITFEIPKGYVIDKENSTDSSIVLKLIEPSRSKTWKEYCEKMEDKDSYYINSTRGGIISSKFGAAPIVSEFDNKEDAEAFVAFSKLLKLRKDWIGDWEPDWNNDNAKYVICCVHNKLAKDTLFCVSSALSFPSEKMRDEFFDCFKNLLEEAKTLL